MLFDPKDLLPCYTAEEIEKLFFIRKELSDLNDPGRRALLEKVNSIGLRDIRLDTVHMLLCVMHEARESDQPRFLGEVFLPWHALRSKTRTHFERVGVELGRLGEFEPGSPRDAAHLVNVYRNIVSDLFDPYLSLVVACFQFREGTFTSIQDADLGQGERTKFEYLASRVNQIYKGRPTFLSGYDPRVRNAISHAGSRGVTYLPDRVVFRNIKRGTPPTVETVSWTLDELHLRVLQLLECVTSVEVATEIFGLDCSEAIVGDFVGYSQFVLHAVPDEARAVLRRRHELLTEKIRMDERASPAEKLDALSRLLFYNCALRDLPVRGVKTSREMSAVCVEVPAAPIDASDDQQVTGRVLELPRYAILARSVFGPMFDSVLVVETDDGPTTQQLFAKFRGAELDGYIEERAGLVDLVNDANWALEGKPIGIQVDFDAIDEAQRASLEDPFLRKPRPPADDATRGGS